MRIEPGATTPTRIILVALSLAAVIAAIHLFTSDEPPNVGSDSLRYPAPSPEQYVTTLDSLGFFSYLDPPYDDSVRSAMRAAFNPDGSVGYGWTESLEDVPDHRIFGFDGEDLFDDGIVDKLSELKLEDSNVRSSADSSRKVDLDIVVNGRRYQIFHNYSDAFNAWRDAAYRLARLLNAELEAQGTTERVYLASGGNDGMLYILTPEQFAYLDRVHRTIAEKPLEVERWGKVNGIFSTP